MGNVLKSLLNSFECSTECSIKHELHSEIANIKFCELNLNQKEIKTINKIIKKKNIVVND